MADDVSDDRHLAKGKERFEAWEYRPVLEADLEAV